VLTISGRGTVVPGALEQGAIRVGDPVEVIGFGVDGDAPLVSIVTGLETFGQTLPQAQAGDNAAVLLRRIRRHRPQFHVRTADTVGLIDLGPGGVAEPGSTVTAEVTLGVPLPLTSGLGFAVREGGHAVAAGTVTQLRD
jgi:elongation factor Tu